jgi:hypothetical protein
MSGALPCTASKTPIPSAAPALERRRKAFDADEPIDWAHAESLAFASLLAEGTPIRYLRSTFLPGEEKCFCLFEGPSADSVKVANERAEIPFERIVEAMHLASEDLN